MGDTHAGAERPQQGQAGRRVAVAGLAAVCLVSALACGALLWQHRAAESTETSRLQALNAARETAMNLATIDHEHARRDVDRVLSGATGDFRDQFTESAKSLVSVVQDTEVTTVGENADAAVESWDGDRGTVLVQVASTVTTVSAAQPQPRVWRLRMTMDRVGDGYKTAAVEYLA